MASLMWAWLPPAIANGAAKPNIAAPWLDLTVTYCIYAKTIWHSSDAGGDVGGYWGGVMGRAAYGDEA